MTTIVLITLGLVQLTQLMTIQTLRRRIGYLEDR